MGSQSSNIDKLYSSIETNAIIMAPSTTFWLLFVKNACISCPLCRLHSAQKPTSSGKGKWPSVVGSQDVVDGGAPVDQVRPLRPRLPGDGQRAMSQVHLLRHREGASRHRAVFAR